MPPSMSTQESLRGRAGARREGVELVLALGQHLRELLQDHRALVEGQRAEALLPDGAGVLEGGAEVEALGADGGDEVAGGRVANRGGVRRAAASGVHHAPLT